MLLYMAYHAGLSTLMFDGGMAGSPRPGNRAGFQPLLGSLTLTKAGLLAIAQCISLVPRPSLEVRALRLRFCILQAIKNWSREGLGTRLTVHDKKVIRKPIIRKDT